MPPDVQPMSVELDLPPLSHRPGIRPGSKGGTPENPGGFVKGDSRINRAGGPRKTELRKTFEQLCRDAIPDAVPVLTAAIHDESHPLKERLHAFSLLADHGYGRPVDRIAIQNLTGTTNNARLLPKSVLDQKVANLLSREVEIDAEFMEITDV